ncbi:hypothetical protein LCGC14_3129370 [marine sediment metagenome]|uniref:Type II secretion system protein GspI C-terminal domain-containing protein n=1 Tax=marine sediment metagenome TaxID=412755 RepID=A0A0F8W039_9ZZZZ|nr:type II secretion system protein [Phycisphaerales bacterium]
MTTRHKKRKAFTLVEAMIAMVVLSIAASGVLLPFAAGASAQMEGARRTLATKLASDRLEKVISTGYDKVFDYAYESEGSMTDANGNFLDDPIYSDFRRGVTPDPATLGDVSLVWVTVTVYYKGEEAAILTTLVGR